MSILGALLWEKRSSTRRVSRTVCSFRVQVISADAGFVLLLRRQSWRSGGRVAMRQRAAAPAKHAERPAEASCCDRWCTRRITPAVRVCSVRSTCCPPRSGGLW